MQHNQQIPSMKRAMNQTNKVLLVVFPDTLSWDEAMAEDPDAVKNWLESAKKEIKELEGKNAWDIVPESIARNVMVIPGTFHRKRNPAGEITK